MLAALERGEHRDLLTSEERSRLEQWLVRGAPATRGGVHPPTFADPRSAEGHAHFLRARRYRPLTAADDEDACGRCHDGAGPRPAGVVTAAAGATACTTCHTEPAGAFACGTCHGGPGRAAPPRDRCFAVGAPDQSGAHGAHTEPSGSLAQGLPCATCHPTPAAAAAGELLAGTHGNGAVEVWFDYARAGARATFDPSTKRCAGTCHARGGQRPTPAWSEEHVGCNDCHGSPPPAHYAGPCASCHREADAVGGALANRILHLNGKVDLGDGSGKCGACHGSGDDPWPSSAAHPAHRAPTSSRAVECGTCHEVPALGARHPIGRGFAAVRLGGLALKGGSRGAFDAQRKNCSQTYCHAGRGGVATEPGWAADESARACGACHSLPPPPPHPVATTCGGTLCHEGSTEPGPTIAPAARAFHLDGTITRGLP